MKRYLKYFADCVVHIGFYFVILPVSAIVCGVIAIPSALELAWYWLKDIFKSWPDFETRG